VVLFQKEDPYADPAFFYHHVAVHLEADAPNAASVRVKIQESEDGTTWVTRYDAPNPLVPGGALDISSYHVRRWVRMLLYSEAAGVVCGTVVIPESQVLPQLVPTELACASFCEQSCETGEETTG
jgi:hypothetical protein